MIAIDTGLYLADYLLRSGTARVVVVPDPEVATLLNTFRLCGVVTLTTPDATAGTLLAAAESALHGGPGVVVTGSGPSAAAIVPAAAQAQIERRPLIALTVEPNGHQSRLAAQQTLDLRAVFAGVSKGSYRLRADNARELIPLAWHLATTPPRGVVHLRVANAELTTAPAPIRGQAHPPAPPPNGEHASLLRRAADLVRAARRIVLLVGPDAVAARAETAVRLLAEQWGAAVVVTPMAKGVVPETDPAFAGVLGGLGDHPILELIEDSDLVVAFGVTSADLVRAWRTTVPTILLTENGPDPALPAEVTLVGPLNAVANALPRQAGDAGDGERRAALTRRSVQDALGYAAPDRHPLTPQHVIAELRRLAAADVPLAVEADLAGLLAAQLWRVTAPRTFLLSNGLGLPGSGLALALAAALHRNGQPVAWLGTDGPLAVRPGLLAHFGGLAIAAPLVVINQGVHTELRREQEGAGYPHLGSEYPPLPGAVLAALYDLAYARAETFDELTGALAAAFTVKHPTLLEVIAERDFWWRLG
ncbi:MAG: thiamine pyrophosphate-binding protein [Sphaerobacter sp.]|nr:thiamine pyrophosphate-binding protein [Sphaerobacter sp.]